MQIEVQELIDRAKTYVDDEHRAEDAWISPERWLTFFNVERRKLYKQWMRAGLVIPSPTTGYLQGESTEFEGVLAIVGVGKDLGGTIQPLPNAAMDAGRQPFWRSATQTSTPGHRWTAFGEGTTVTVELDGFNDLVYSAGPPETGNYLIRYIPTLAEVTDATDVVDLPDGGDERLVLGMAKRAGIKEAGRSALIESEIRDYDADLNLTAHAAAGGVKMRRTVKNPLVPVSPNRWIYFG